MAGPELAEQIVLYSWLAGELSSVSLTSEHAARHAIQLLDA
jgi:hypothetical protein